MPLFLKKTIVFIFVSLGLFFIIGIYFENIIADNFKNNSQIQLQEDWHIKHNKKNELLFLGNSRTWVQIDAKLITEKINKKSYCLAQDGRDAKILYFKLKTYLLYNNAPRLIFVQFDPFFLTPFNYNTFYGKNNYLAYLFGDKLGINSLFKKEIGYNYLDEYVPLLRYFNTENGIFIFFNHLKMKNSVNDSTFIYGSALRKIKWNSVRVWSKPDNINVTLDYKYLDSIINLCNENNIKTVLIYPPQSYPSYCFIQKRTIVELQYFAKKRKLTFWNFNDKKYNDSSLFYNHTHTNAKGSLIYTNDLIDSMFAYRFSR